MTLRLKMKTSIFGLCLIGSAASADVIIPGPPIVAIKLSSAERASRLAEARKAAEAVTSFSGAERSAFLDVAYRALGKKDIQSVDRTVDVKLVGDRAYIVAVGRKWLNPQMIGETYIYLQCLFDDAGHVVGMDVL